MDNCPIRIHDEFESKHILSSSGIPVVEEAIVSNLAGAKKFAMETGYPLVLKGLIPKTVHKSEKGLVELNLYQENQLDEAFSRIEDKLNGRGKILIQRQVKIDYELIAGYLKDEHFGPCVLFGIGGFFVELEPDIAFSLAPLNRDRAENLMERIRSQKLFQGFRTMEPLNREIMADLLIKLSVLGSSRPEIRQIDINPIAVFNGLPVVIDANIIDLAKN
jgi:acetyltransferase